VEVIIGNIEKWVTTIQQNAITLQKTPLSQAAIQAIVTLAGEALNGVGQGGIVTAFSEAQQMATLTLVSKS
jgi:hypothetical protein